MLFVMGTVAWLMLRGMTRWTSDSNWAYLPMLLVDTYLLGLLICLLPKSGRTIALSFVYIIMYASGFLESFIYQRYFTHLTPQTLTMVQETTATESEGFVRLCLESPIFWQTMLFWAILPAAHGLALALRWWLHKRYPMLRETAKRWAARLLIPLTAISTLWWAPAKVRMLQFLMIERTEQAERTDNGIFYNTAWRVVYALKFNRLSHRELERLARNMRDIEVAPTDTGVPLIILIIGESHNKHHSSLYGYSLPTTPWQDSARQQGLMVAMQDVVTPWNVTSSLFKELMSTHSSDQKGQWSDGVLFPALMRKAGYKVGFITNQFYKSNRQSSVNYNGSFFLNSQPFDSLCFDFRNTKHYLYDKGMLRELPGEPAGRHFIILHLLGQHQPYDERSTKPNRLLTAADIGRADLTEAERQMVAHYDNATIENDRVLQAVYERYRDKDAVIIYLADHGEEVYDGDIAMFGRNHAAEPTPAIMRAEFEVPLEIFVTPMAQKARPWLMDALRSAEQKPFATYDIAHLILRLGGVNTKYYDPTRDLLAVDFLPRPRPVKGGVDTYENILTRRADSLAEHSHSHD